MTTTPFVETEALLAALRGEHAETMRLVDEMLASERDALAKAARALATYADPANRCPGCDKFVAMVDAVTVGLLSNVRRTWHQKCRQRGAA